MAKIIIQPNPRTWRFDVNGYTFFCQIEWRDTTNIKAKDILIWELEECVKQLKEMPEFKVEQPFKLPPLNPNDSS